MTILAYGLAAWLTISIGGTTLALLILEIAKRLEARRARSRPLCPVIELDTRRRRRRRLGDAA